MNVRAIAAGVLYQVAVRGRSLTECLHEALKQVKEPRDKSFLQALCYGGCRYYHAMAGIADFFLDKPLKKEDQDIYCLILLGLLQIKVMHVPAHAAVDETVAAAMDLKKPWAKALINAVLRNYQRRLEEWEQQKKLNLEALYSHPTWIINKLKKDWPDDWKEVLVANNMHPPFSLRVNQSRLMRDEYIAVFEKTLGNVKIIPETSAGITLEKPMDVHDLPGFSEGMVSVQDGAAQLAVELLQLEPGQRVLDTCAAPGGKTTQMLEWQPDAKVVAVEIDADRLKRVRENLQRLELTAKCIHADVTLTDGWWDGVLFDRILVDAPCSAMGVIRRHPDIKLLRRQEDIAAVAKTQARILNGVWKMLKPGGLLVYAVCSIFLEEGADVVQAFLAKNPDAKEDPLNVSWGKACAVGRQLLPGMGNMDGFYYARLKKC